MKEETITYWARKQEEVRDADGDIITIQKWHFDTLLETPKGTIINEKRMGRFLDGKKITEIEIRDAIKMWTNEKEERAIKGEVEGAKKMKVIFDGDALEVGDTQALRKCGYNSVIKC